MLRKLNWPIIICVVVLSIFSLALIFSLEPDLVLSQAGFIIIGVLVFGFFTWINYQIFTSLFLPLIMIVGGFLGSTFLFGTLTRSTLRWVRVGSFSFQPSELVKPLLILAFASYASLPKWEWKHLGFNLLFFLIPAWFVFQQPDLGSALVIFLVWLTITAFKINRKQALVLSLVLLISFMIGWNFAREYQKERIEAFFNPHQDPLGQGYHLIQAKIAAGSGQLIGRGLFRGTQSHLKFLPERHSDFIFASLAEELGFVGSGIILITYFVLLGQILKIAKTAADQFGMLVCIGVFALIFSQIVINVGMNLGLLPITGLTLPLVSTGGSSVVALMVSLGLAESVKLRSKNAKSIEIR